MTNVWRCRFNNGLVDGAEVDVSISVPPALAFVSPCPKGCEVLHAQVDAHLSFDPERAPLRAVVYRRTALDRPRMLAVYELGDVSERSPAGERELVEA